MPDICITFSWLSPVEHLCQAAQHGKHAARWIRPKPPLSPNERLAVVDTAVAIMPSAKLPNRACGVPMISKDNGLQGG